MSNAPHDPPFRAELIGSLLRPQRVKDARRAHEDGALTDAELHEIENEEIARVVTMQEEYGFRVATDGELRRSTYSDSFTTHGITGIEEGPDLGGVFSYTDDKGDIIGQRVPRIVDKVGWAGPTNVANYKYLASCVTKALPKVTLPGPAYIHFRSGRVNISRDVYPDLDDYWNDLCEAYGQEMRALADAGCRYIQLDETSIAKLGDPKIREGLTARGDNWEELLDTYINAVNMVAAKAPEGVSLGMHLCRGNKAGHWQAAGGYEVVAEKLFREARIRFYFLEYDSPRAGGFEPLEALPEDKTVVIGAMTTKSGFLESVEILKSRIQEAARYVDLDRLAISPQCGFSSSVEGVMEEAQERAKLARLIEVARDIWGAA